MENTSICNNSIEMS
jgi:transposase